MKKIKNLANMNYLWLLLGSYFIVVLFNLLRFSTEALFLKLGEVGIVGTIIGVVIIYPFLWFIGEYKKLIDIGVLNTFLTALILFVAILKSPTLFLSLGLIMISVALFLFFYLEKIRFAIIFPVLVVLSFPKLLLQASGNFQDEALKIHSFNIAESKFTSLIWPILTSVVIALLIGLIISRLAVDKISKVWVKRLTLMTLIIGVCYVLYLSVVVYYKVKANSGSTFDIGIFSQMFERMKTDFTQITTLERDKALSHFAVHISPIFYAILPFYMLLPYVETLEILQILIVFSAVIPLGLVLKKLQLPKLLNPLVIALFFATPAMTTSGSYHIHENCFLPPLILWLFYAIISQWRLRTILFALLILFVKEDSFIYVLSLGLYFVFQNRFSISPRFKKWLYASTFVLPVVYFGFAMFLLTKYGEGAMVSRYSHLLMSGENGLLMVMKNTILNPLYVLGSLFTAKKLGYIFLILFPLGFLPLVQRRLSTYFLMLPLLAINLLTDWLYQYDINFQYSYGSVTLLFIMGLLALDQLSNYKVVGEKALVALVASSLVISGGILYSYTHKWNFEIKYYHNRKDYFEGIQSVLKDLPIESSVVTTGSYTPSLRQHEKLYDIYYHNDKKVDLNIDYVVVPRETRQEGKGFFEADILKAYEASGYKESFFSTEDVLVLEK